MYRKIPMTVDTFRMSKTLNDRTKSEDYYRQYSFGRTDIIIVQFWFQEQQNPLSTST